MDPDSPAETATPAGADHDEGLQVSEAEPEVPKQVYLRTVYPLNPGIPHYVDVPGGW